MYLFIQEALSSSSESDKGTLEDCARWAQGEHLWILRGGGIKTVVANIKSFGGGGGGRGWEYVDFFGEPCHAAWLR